MGEHTDIEWSDGSFSPWEGCVKVSEACKNCYAERFAERFRGVPGHPFAGLRPSPRAAQAGRAAAPPQAVDRAMFFRQQLLCSSGDCR